MGKSRRNPAAYRQESLADGKRPRRAAGTIRKNTRQSVEALTTLGLSCWPHFLIAFREDIRTSINVEMLKS